LKNSVSHSKLIKRRQLLFSFHFVRIHFLLDKEPKHLHECYKAVCICDKFEECSNNKQDINNLPIRIVLRVKFYPIHKKDIAKQDKEDLNLCRP
jgi:hypothetical protein